MNIKQIRADNKMTQEQLAEVLEIDRSTVAKWENGSAMPRAKMLSKLAELLNCTVDDLLADK